MRRPATLGLHWLHVAVVSESDGPVIMDRFINHQVIPAMEREIILEMSKLLEKMGLEHIIPVWPADNANAPEATLINLKSLNARYEKGEALTQVKWLMETYNIQIDELIERISL